MAAASCTPLDAALLRAAGAGDCYEVSRQLAAGARINATDANNNTALHEAAMKGFTSVAQLLLGAGARAHALNSAGNDALHRAIAGGHAALALLICRHAPGAHFSAVHVAALEEGDSCTRVELTPDNVNAVDGCGYTPLLVAAAVGNTAMAVRLLGAGANRETANKNGTTPLHSACENGHTACVRALVGAGANTEAADCFGWTPLCMASQNGHDACVRALLGAGANKDAKTRHRRTPLFIASRYGHDACVRALLEVRPHLEAADKNNWTALHVACQNGHDAVAHLLLHAGASLTARATDGSTPMMFARAAGHVSIMRLLQDAEDGRLPPLPSTPATLAPAPVPVPVPTSVSAPVVALPSVAPVTTPTAPATFPVAVAATTAAAAPTITCELSFKDLKFDRDEDDIQIELGQGAFGIVYAGRWKGERVAIKKMTLPVEQVTSGHFWSEVRLHMQASYKHVVRVYGAAVRPVPHKVSLMACYVVMDRLVADLSSVLHDTYPAAHPAHNMAAAVRPLPQRLRLLLEIARGVRFLHAQGIVHADLKPGNVMLDADGHAQLTDFGLAVQRALDASRTRGSHKGERGTLAYMDPALAESGGNASVKPSSDMYSWGVLAWQVLTLRKPYGVAVSDDGGAGGDGASASAGARASSASSGAAIPSFSRLTFDGERPQDVLARTAPDVPLSLRDLIQCCWAEEQRARPSAEAAVALLERIVEA